MEAIYIPELDNNQEYYFIEKDELKHIKALRLKVDGHLLAVNGKGLAAELVITIADKNRNQVKALNFYNNYNELPFKLGLAIGNLAARDRIEFAVEKAVELGAGFIYILDTRYSQKSAFKPERLKSKAIAAMKQSKRSVLPEINGLWNIKNILSVFQEYDYIILCEPGGEKPAIPPNKNILVLIGPEGGFSSEEIELFNKEKKLVQWDLGKRRLRAETAAISALSYFSSR